MGFKQWNCELNITQQNKLEFKQTRCFGSSFFNVSNKQITFLVFRIFFFSKFDFLYSYERLWTKYASTRINRRNLFHFIAWGTPYDTRLVVKRKITLKFCDIYSLSQTLLSKILLYNIQPNKHSYEHVQKVSNSYQIPFNF